MKERIAMATEPDIEVWGEVLLLTTQEASEQVKYRLRLYVGWLAANGSNWLIPNFAAYRDYLLSDFQGRGGRPLSASSAATHLHTIRARYVYLLKSNRLHDLLYRLMPQDASAAEKEAFFHAAHQQLCNALDLQGII
jgi:hypothetical protein